MESAVNFAPLRPADFVNFAGRGGAGQGLLFAGRGGLFFRGAGRPSLVHIWVQKALIQPLSIFYYTRPVNDEYASCNN